MLEIKRFAPQITTLFLIILLMTAGITRDLIISIRADNDPRPIILLDPGHGGVQLILWIFKVSPKM